MIRYISILLFTTGCLGNDCSLEYAKGKLGNAEFDDAIECYTYLTATKDSFEAFVGLGDCYWKQQAFDSCIKYYGRTLSWSEVPIYVVVNLGDAHFKKGESLKALNCFLLVERQDSLYPTVNFNLAIIYMQEFKLYEKALAFALREYQIEPTNTDNVNLVGQLYLNIDSTDRAIYYFSRSIALDSSVYMTYFLRANAYMEKGEQELAYSDFSSCLLLNPNFEDALVEKSRIEEQLRKGSR